MMMNKQEILKKIGHIIQELNEQHEYLTAAQKINILELELFTANADFLIDHIEILKKLNHNLPEHNAETEQRIPFAKPALQQQEVLPEEESEAEEDPVSPEAEEEELPDFKFSFEEHEPTEMIFDFEKKLAVEDVFDRELTPEEQELIEEKKKTLEVKPAEIITPEDEILEDEAGEEPFLIESSDTSEPFKPIEVFQQSTPIEKVNTELPKVSLNDMLSAKKEHQQHSASYLNKAVVDLKASITLNDKMMFIRELFNGYNLAYSEAIEILNRFDSFEAADNFLLKNYAEKNNWSQKQDVVDRLYEILNRKFRS